MGFSRAVATRHRDGIAEAAQRARQQPWVRVWARAREAFARARAISSLRNLAIRVTTRSSRLSCVHTRLGTQLTLFATPRNRRACLTSSTTGAPARCGTGLAAVLVWR